ncbi:hypothetical protein MFRU_019g01120 [Monilinia fructicola]|nr:hypothetical protein MFRU_019g01120 [Monilinia fructicola]
MENINHDADVDSGRSHIRPFGLEESQWYEAISAEYNGEYITGHIVDRQYPLHYTDFFTAMYSIGTECSFLVENIFDSRARLLQHWISGNRKGSGIWDSRLNTGDFLVIEIAFKKSDRENNLSHLFSEILNKVKNKVRWIFVSPGRIIVDGVPRMLSGKSTYLLMNEDERSTAIAFWRAKGFRRIGLSHWFCYAIADNDPSRNLSARDDYYNSDDEIEERWAATSTPTDSTKLENDEDGGFDEDDENNAVGSEQPVGLEQSLALSDTPSSEKSEIDMRELDNITINIHTQEPVNTNSKIHKKSNNIDIKMHAEQVNNIKIKIKTKKTSTQRTSGHQEESEEQNLSNEDETIFMMEDL